MRRVRLLVAGGAGGVVGDRPRTGAGDRRHRLRRRSRHRRRRTRADRERVVRRERRALRAGRPGRRRARARGCDAREPRRQDRDAGDHRHAHPSQPDARDARRRPAPAGLLRRRRGDESRSGHDGRVVPGARADDAGPGEVLHGRARDHGAGAGPHDRAVLGDDGRGSAQGGAGQRGEESRHHQDLGRRSHGHGEEALARALHARSSTKRTRTDFASSRTSTRSTTRRRRCAPASTRSRTACATRTWTTSSWRS